MILLFSQEVVFFKINKNIGRIRKLMKMDPSVKIISKQALSVMSKATVRINMMSNEQNLFVDLLANKTEKYLNTHDSKQVKV